MQAHDGLHSPPLEMMPSQQGYMPNNTIDHPENEQNVASRAYARDFLSISNLLVLVLFLWGLFAACVAAQLEWDGATTEGVLLKQEETSTEDGTEWIPVVEFRVDGQSYQARGNISSTSPQYHIGQRVTVRYDIAQPNRAQLDSWWERWVKPIVLIPSALFMALLLNMKLLHFWKRNKPNEI